MPDKLAMCERGRGADLYHLRAVPVTDNMQAFERAVSGDVSGVVAQKGR